MAEPSHPATATNTEPSPHSNGSPHREEPGVILNAAARAIARHSFCTLATASRSNRPHVVGVIYAAVNGRLYVHTLTGSKKARNIRENAHVAICIPVRKYPLAPPFCVQFQGNAQILSPSDPEIAALLEAGRLKNIAAHGALALPDACIIRVTPGHTMSTYGIGVPLLTLLRDPFHASRSVANGTARLR